jgi:hypothetical protein
MTNFQDMSGSERATTVVTLAVSLALVVAAERDVHRRSDEELRGSKLLWRIVCLNAIGALVYFRWGRKPASAPAAASTATAAP